MNLDIDGLRKAKEFYQSSTQELGAHLASRDARIEKLREALKYYAHELCPADDPSDGTALRALAEDDRLQREGGE